MRGRDQGGVVLEQGSGDIGACADGAPASRTLAPIVLRRMRLARNDPR